MHGVARAVRRLLDLIYNICGGIAAIFLILILFTILTQMLARWTGEIFPGSTDYAGYFMAAASFFAMAYAFNHGAHIRVSLFLSKLGAYRRWGEIWCFGIGSLLAGYFAFYAIKAVYWSRKLNDISQGQDALPLWIPQLPMAIGTTVLTLALVDHLIRILLGGMPDLGEHAAEDHRAE